MPELLLSRRQTSRLIGAAGVVLLALPEMLHGTPGTFRLAWVGLMVLLAAFLSGWLDAREDLLGPDPAMLLRWDRWFALGLSLYALLAFVAVSWLFELPGSQLMPQDTGYFEQCIWNTLNGKGFLAGSSQQLWRYDPPLTSHFAMHSTPALLGVVGVYALWPSFHALHAVQVLAVVSGALPVWWIWRKHAPRLGLLWVAAYCFHPAVLSQTQLSFHELALAVPGVSLLTFAWLHGRLKLAFLGALLSLLAREDLALLVCLAGLLGAALKPGQRVLWCLLFALGLGGWIAAAKVMAGFGASGGQVILALFAQFGKTPGEIVWGMLSRPDAVLQMLLEGHRLEYLLGLARPGLLGSLASPVSLVILPALLINLLVRGAGTAWLDVHYSVYLPPVLMLASAWVWRNPPHWLGLLTRSTLTPARVGALVLPLSLLGLPSVLTRERLEEYRPGIEGPTLRTLLTHVPADARLAMPRHALHLAAQRERLYIVNRVAEYTVWDAEFILLDRDPKRFALQDGSAQAYAAFAEVVAQSPRFVKVAEQPLYLLYRDLQSRYVPLGPGGHPPHPARAPTTAGPIPVFHPSQEAPDQRDAPRDSP